MNTTALAVIQPQEMDTIVHKQCTLCKEEKPLTDFPRNRSRKDGYEYRCKVCHNRLGKEWVSAHSEARRAIKRRNYWKNPEKENAIVKERHKRNPEPMRQRAIKYGQRHPLRKQAVNAVNMAVASDKMPRVDTLVCAKCEKSAKEYHHWSYETEHWLDVVPLCRSCHRLIHTEMKREGKQL